MKKAWMTGLLLALPVSAQAEESVSMQAHSWESLGTMAGATAATLMIVQLIKAPLDKIWKLPTRLVVYLVALMLLLAARGFTGGNMKQGYLLCLSFMCVIAVPLTFIQYFYTRERITEERRLTDVDETETKTPEASFGTQLKACVKDKYWIMFILLIFIYQILFLPLQALSQL